MRRGIYLYLERQTYLSWINAKCPPPSKKGDPKKWGTPSRVLSLDLGCGWVLECWDQAKREVRGQERRAKGYNKSPLNFFIIFSLFGDFLEGRHTTLS
jgi:hypothetical protein